MNESGRLCLGILQEDWSPALSIPKALEAVRLLLVNPDTDNALRQLIAELTIAHQRTGGQDRRYAESAAAAIRASDASRTVGEWRAEWGL